VKSGEINGSGISSVISMAAAAVSTAASIANGGVAKTAIISISGISNAAAAMTPKRKAVMKSKRQAAKIKSWHQQKIIISGVSGNQKSINGKA